MTNQMKLMIVSTLIASIFGLGCLAPQLVQPRGSGFPELQSTAPPATFEYLQESPSMNTRNLSFNGERLDARGIALVERLELTHGVRLPDGAYWYDAKTGALGNWGGPAVGLIAAGLPLGGSLKADCSGGTTGVFVNGRELHPTEVAQLTALVGPFQRGRYWADAQGNVGLEGGPALVNLVAVSKRRSGGRNWSRTADYGTGRTHVGGDGNTTYFLDSNGNSVIVGD